MKTRKLLTVTGLMAAGGLLMVSGMILALAAIGQHEINRKRSIFLDNLGEVRNRLRNP